MHMFRCAAPSEWPPLVPSQISIERALTLNSVLYYIVQCSIVPKGRGSDVQLVPSPHGGSHDLTVCPSGSCVWPFRGTPRVADSPGSGTAPAGQSGDQRGSRDRRLANGQDPF